MLSSQNIQEIITYRLQERILASKEVTYQLSMNQRRRKMLVVKKKIDWKKTFSKPTCIISAKNYFFCKSDSYKAMTGKEKWSLLRDKMFAAIAWRKIRVEKCLLRSRCPTWIFRKAPHISPWLFQEEDKETAVEGTKFACQKYFKLKTSTDRLFPIKWKQQMEDIFQLMLYWTHEVKAP